MSSLLSALSVGTLGLQAQSNSLDVISNNIANANTVGYKSALASFQELINNGSAIGYDPGGVDGGSQQNNETSGEITGTQSPTDLAISGEGFFPVSQTADDSTGIVYTRAGSFTQDANGNLINGAGYYLQGWPLDSTGGLAAGLSTPSVDAGTAIPALQTINISQLNETAVPTANVSIISNLNASQAAYAGTGATAYNPLTYNMASGDVAPQFTGDVSVVDSTGATHQLTVGYLKTGTNTWAVEVYGATSDVTNPGGQIASGTLTFNGDGSLASVSPSLTNMTATWQAAGAGSNTLAVNWGTAGVIAGTPNATVIGKTDGVEQVTGQYSFSDTQDGIEPGSLSGISVSNNGIVSGNYTNGSSRALYQIPLATFRDEDQLASASGNIFTATQNSGDPSFFQPSTTGGVGDIQSNALESSNVNISTELTNMIIAQQAYGTNSKVLTTTDTMLSDAITMVV